MISLMDCSATLQNSKIFFYIFISYSQAETANRNVCIPNLIPWAAFFMGHIG